MSSGQLDANRDAERVLERRQLPLRSPELELRVADSLESQDVARLIRGQIEPSDDLRVAAIQPFRQPHDRRQDLDGVPQARAQRFEFLV